MGFFLAVRCRPGGTHGTVGCNAADAAQLLGSGLVVCPVGLLIMLIADVMPV